MKEMSILILFLAGVLVAVLLSGCTEQQAREFSDGAAAFRAGTSSWRQPAYQPPRQVQCIAHTYGYWTRVTCY